MEEIWKDIEGYEGKYLVSNLGRVKSLARTVDSKNGSIRNVAEKILKPDIEDGFYYRVRLSDGHGNKKAFIVSRLVALAFIPNPNNYPNALHKDETLPLDESHAVGNLFWGTQKHNMEDCVIKGRKAIILGENKSNSKLSEVNAKKILDYIDQGLKNREIAPLVPDATMAMIKNIRKGDSWGYLRK